MHRLREMSIEFWQERYLWASWLRQDSIWCLVFLKQLSFGLRHLKVCLHLSVLRIQSLDVVVEKRLSATTRIMMLQV